jgi:hypothetical protein
LPLDSSNATQRQKLSNLGSHVAAQSPSPQTRAGLKVEARRLLYTFDLTVVSVHVKAKELKSLSGSTRTIERRKKIVTTGNKANLTIQPQSSMAGKCHSIGTPLSRGR